MQTVFETRISESVLTAAFGILKWQPLEYYGHMLYLRVFLTLVIEFNFICYTALLKWLILLKPINGHDNKKSRYYTDKEYLIAEKPFEMQTMQLPR